MVSVHFGQSDNGAGTAKFHALGADYLPLRTSSVLLRVLPVSA
jgi:hypothetical protein